MPMIDPMLSLAFSVHSNKGVYALMLGSGISRSTGIPTGWEVVLDLIRRIANLVGEDCEPEPAEWYRSKYGHEPDYSEVLNEVAKSPAERSQLLKTYFEPTDEEREQGLKLPTVAHRAIANLVKDGYIRVIVTTNFDRLTEKALEDVGVNPTVIATPDSIDGALPIVHSQCTILKVHGDYLDTRMKNTPSELEIYDEKINKLLDRILDEYGVIICGWSAEWDVALRTAFERCSNHRFTTYWTSIAEPQEMAKRLINNRRAEKILISGADSFFNNLAEKVSALQEMNRPHPLSVKIAITNLKRYLSDVGRFQIYLHDLLMNEAENVSNSISDEKYPLNSQNVTSELSKRINEYDMQLEPLINLIINGCYWGDKSQEQLWIKCLELIANRPGGTSGLTQLIKFRQYPSLLLIYAGGIASIAAKKFYNFIAVVEKPKYKTEYVNALFVQKLYPVAIMETSLANQVLNYGRRQYTPLNDHIYNILKEPFKQILPLESDYDNCFDYFEYLFALVFIYNKNYSSGQQRVWAPVGRFGWRYEDNPNHSIFKIIENEIEIEKENWAPLRENMFGGKTEIVKEVKDKLDSYLNTISW